MRIPFSNGYDWRIKGTDGFWYENCRKEEIDRYIKISPKDFEQETISENTQIYIEKSSGICEPIYYGDILEFTPKRKEQGEKWRALVNFGNYYGLELRSSKCSPCFGQWVVYEKLQKWKYKVIGNKWDNPDLLKGL